MSNDLAQAQSIIYTEAYHKYNPEKLDKIIRYTNDVSSLMLLLPWLGPRLRLVVATVSAASAAVEKGREYIRERKTDSYNNSPVQEHNSEEIKIEQTGPSPPTSN